MKHVIVTGGSRGIGNAIASRLVKDGYSVTITGREEGTLKEAAQALGAQYRALDMRDRAAVEAFTASWTEPLYGIVNNAGICKTENIADGMSVWDEVLATNLTGPAALVSGLAKKLEDNGRIVNISSQLGKEGRAGYSAYCASKFGVIGLTKTWAKELGGRGITVNAICPGWVSTEMSTKDVERIAQEKGKSTEEFYKEICAPLELKRFTTPEEIANLAAFLISEDGSGVTGRDWLLNTVWNQE